MLYYYNADWASGSKKRENFNEINKTLLTLHWENLCALRFFGTAVNQRAGLAVNGYQTGKVG